MVKIAKKTDTRPKPSEFLTKKSLIACKVKVIKRAIYVIAAKIPPPAKIAAKAP